MNRTLLLGGVAISSWTASTICAPAAPCFTGSDAVPPPYTHVSNGTTYCAVDLASYNSVTTCSNGTSFCSGSSCAPTLSSICLADFHSALLDAGKYFAASPTSTLPFEIIVPSGTYDFTSDQSTNGPIVINLSDAISTSSTALTSSTRLVLQGAGLEEGNGGTELITSHQLQTIGGNNISHVTIAGMHFGRDYTGIGQGTLTSTGSIVGESYLGTTCAANAPSPTIKVAMQYFANTPGFYDLTTALPAIQEYNQYNSPKDALLVRAYTNTAIGNRSVPNLDISDVNNYQISWHDICDANGNNCVSNHGTPGVGGTLTFVLGQNPCGLDPGNSNSHTAYSWYQTVTQQGGTLFLCFREVGDGANFTRINDTSPGTDLVYSNLKLTEDARMEIVGISNAQFINVQVDREPPANRGSGASQAQCLSTNGGGIQLKAPTYGNIINGMHAEATGDDSIAFFGDTGSGSTTSSVINSNVQDSFSHDVLTANTGTAASNIYVPPYVSPGQLPVIPPPNDTSTSCSSTVTGANCLIYVMTGCLTNSGTTSNTYCPVGVSP